MALALATASIDDALTAAERLPHRRELVREVSGVRFVDDSKATNPHAAIAAAPDLPILAGGKSMGGRMTSLAAAEAPLPGVRGLVIAARDVTRRSEAEAALSSDFSSGAIAGLSVPADGMISDLHGSADYRANLVAVMTGRAVDAANG